MALVLVYDFLFGRGLQVGGQLKQVINRNKTGLQAALARMKVKAKVVTNEELLPQNILEQQGRCFAGRESSSNKRCNSSGRLYTAKNTQVEASLLQGCYLAVIKSISGCVRITCSGLMTTSLLQVVNTLDAS